mgnify:CR=1 FL=1
MEIPVYLFTGFLEAGKTKFIQETLEDERFAIDENTLLLLCEEGEEEFDPSTFSCDVALEIIDDKSKLNAKYLAGLQKKHKSARVLVEYNGMWMLDRFYNALPQNWMVYQEFMFADATTFLSYNRNIRANAYDMLKSCDLVVFNRFEPDMDKMAFHKIVRGASRKADIAYEYADGKVEYDDIVDPLPYDLNAPIVEIQDTDYAIWYRELSEEPEPYEGKTFRFKCQMLGGEKVPAGNFIVGREIMACCEDDLEFAGLLLRHKGAAPLKESKWVILTAKINFKFTKVYGRKGPVLSFVAVEDCDAPEQPVATFY